MTSTFLLAVAAAVYPTLPARVIVLLGQDRAVPLLAGFLGGGVLVSLVRGLIVVFVLDGAVSTSSQRSASPTVDLVLGGLSVLLAAVLFKQAGNCASAERTGPPESRPATRGLSGSPRGPLREWPSAPGWSSTLRESGAATVRPARRSRRALPAR
jgi:hypothetical protein